MDRRAVSNDYVGVDGCRSLDARLSVLWKMNISATIGLRFGGPGSGCQGDHCGRPKSSIALYELGHDEKSGTHAFNIFDGETKLGRVEVHMANEGEKRGALDFPKGTLVVDWTSGNFKSVSAIKGVIRELKKEFPEAKYFAGERISGIHYRYASRPSKTDVPKSYDQFIQDRWTVVPIHAVAD